MAGNPGGQDRRADPALFRPEYAASSDVLILLMIAGTVAYLAWFAGFGMTAAREFRSQIPLLSPARSGAASAGA